MRKTTKRKTLLASILLFSISASSDQILWTCTEPDVDDAVTTCISSKGKKTIITSDDDLTILGNDFKATLEILGTSISGTVVGKNDIYFAELYWEGQTVIGNINKDLIFIGNQIEFRFEKFNDSADEDIAFYKGEFKYDDEGLLTMEGKGESSYFNGDKYVGEFRDDRRHGRGTLTSENGQEIYKGDFKLGYQDGYGERLTALFIEEGEYDKGVISKGTRIGIKGGEYEGHIANGEFDSNGKLSGLGKYKYADGSILEGSFSNGLLNGMGKETFTDGTYYEGTFLEGRWNGPGKRTSISDKGNTYIYFNGTWIDGRVSEGTILYPNGSTHMSGQYNKDFQLHGNGILYSYNEDGSFDLIWEGEFKNGLLNGYGTFYGKSGYKYKGEWRNGITEGLCEISTNTTIETGFCSKKGLEGEGKLYSTEYNWEWVGPFKDGLKNGQGVTTFFDSNNKYYATFIDGIYQEDNFKEITEERFLTNKRIALVIGNNDYISSPLQYAVKDADGITQVLEKSGFEVIKIQDATQENFLEALYEFKRKIILAGPRTDVLFFYAGHASQVRGINYLNPVDAVINRESQLETSSINMNRVFEVLNESIDGVKIAILDSCRNNPFVSSIRSSKQGLAQMSAPPGTIIAYSTAPGETAIDGSSKGFGIYTGSLIEAINQPGLRIEEVFKETRKSVVSVTKGQQIPWDSSSLISDFYFVKEN